ncbi:hypothetical protein B1748_08805 [Paenibacillus sp. MY03]|uniref:glycoside hydrolase family 38 N-terminal domain-containing protein n=1 Tax=Paenibacillus sp. MY03 TaxID=302980 RepID=UPI000B3CAE36|nr:alpha-mannosidase [Paenibacillus sp. MY03]OUS77237.1 hypothetical protein B1748_08805 [Paenibacillus sp. MY03]
MTGLDTRLLHLIGYIPNSYWDEKITRKPSYWTERIIAQLVFAREMSKVNDNGFDSVIEPVVSLLEHELKEEGAITKKIVLKSEAMLAPLQEAAKKYRILSVAHAHIDMNWKWPWHETVSVVLDTFKTMLKLLEEYPDFRFSQSQGAIYHIVEKYDPEMLEEIKTRVAEGRWEVTASHWVEADKNMPSGESLVRQILYNKRYLSSLFNLDMDQLSLDFEPDTFGHSLHVPEILSGGGVNYYYHCRGSEGPLLYRWEAPSGQSVIAYREPTWYSDYVQAIIGAYVPDICRQTGLDTYLYVYGVGDHGGGPTRRDLERLLDMREWPVYPTIEFGTYGQFFKLAESVAEQLPVVRGEQNVVFTGCYTSQTRIKKANRLGEAALNEAEAFRVVAGTETGMHYPAQSYEQAWRNVLFNQFHDILPGSGIVETREHALGLFQETMAIAVAGKKKALERLAETIDTSALAQSDHTEIAEGAGVGFGMKRFSISQVERGSGKVRIAHVFNPSWQAREEVVEWILWDWKSPGRSFVVRDADGVETPHQVMDQGYHHYWGHDYMRVLFKAQAPAFGYNTYTLSEAEHVYAPAFPSDSRLEKPKSYRLENDVLCAEFDPLTAAVVSLYHKPSGSELIDPNRPAGMFRLIKENADQDMTAWIIAEYMSMENLHSGVKWTKADTGGLRQSLGYELNFGRSLLKVVVKLDAGSNALIYHVECDWQEVGKRGDNVPQLNFNWPVSYSCSEYQYDVPFGTIVRQPIQQDMPACSWIRGARDGDDLPSIQVVTDSKYGFRGVDDAMAVSLIRSSFDPDPYPEQGNHHQFTLGIIVQQPMTNEQRITDADHFMHPLTVLSGTAHGGSRPLKDSFLELIEGTVAYSALKQPEERGQAAWIIRLYETDGLATKVKLKVKREVSRVCLVDGIENEREEKGSIALDNPFIELEVKPYQTAAIKIVFA